MGKIKFTEDSQLKWQKEKPDYACIFLTRDNGHYNVWEFAWQHGAPRNPEDAQYGNIDGETRYYYLAWLDNDGDEWDAIEDCNFDEYLVLRKLPTMDEVHKAWVEMLKKDIII